MPSAAESLVSVGRWEWLVSGGLSTLADGDAPVTVELAMGAETERGELNEGLRGGKGGPLGTLGGDPSRQIRGAPSCGRSLVVWSGE